QRCYREGSEGEPPVESEHQGEDSREQAGVEAENGNTVGNHLLDRLGIRSQSRNQVPRALLIMEPQRKALQMREEIPANGEDKVLCEIAHRARKVIRQYPRDDRDQ